MKHLAFLAPIAAVLVVGCASERHLTLAPIGPPPALPAQGSAGALVVFSATARNARFSSLPYQLVYSDYELRSEDGKFLQTVHNDTGTSFSGPKTVALSPGTYQIFARANGYGYIIVPVIIRPNQTTTVHLEGGGWSNSAVPADPIRLPGGEIAGWSAEAKLKDYGSSLH